MIFNAEKFRANLTDRLSRQYGKDLSQANMHDLYGLVAGKYARFV